MDKEKGMIIGKKMEALACGFIGILFFSWGTNYLFSVRLIYNVPRILEPIFDYLGSTAFAISMLLLGLGLIAWGFKQWNSVGGKKSLYLTLAAVGLAIGIFLSNYNFRSSEEIMQSMEENRQTQIEEIKKTTRPDFNNPEIDKLFDDFDALYARMEDATSADEEKLYDEYMQWSARITDLVKKLDTDQMYEFSKYNAKLAVQWSDKLEEIRDK